MDTNAKSSAPVTPVKLSKLNRSKSDEISRNSENCNPNMRSVGLNSSNSPNVKSATKLPKSAKKANPISDIGASPPNKERIRGRKFVIAKKNSTREKGNSSTTLECQCNSNSAGDGKKCRCVAKVRLRASQEDFFKNCSRAVTEDENKLNKYDCTEIGVQGGENGNLIAENSDETVKGYEEKLEDSNRSDDACRLKDRNERKVFAEMSVSTFNNKRRGDEVLEAGTERLPESGVGRVMHLVKAFENILSFPKSKDSEKNNEDESEGVKKEAKLSFPGLPPPMGNESQVSLSSFCPSDLRFSSESLGLDSRLSSSSDSSQGSISSKKTRGHRRSKSNNDQSSRRTARRHKKRVEHKSTFQQPFNLRTELRGRCKEEEFVKKVQQMIEEDEKRRIPVAQGLPWTTDEPERLVKPPVKDITQPADLVLHSDVRAVERAEFDHQVAEKMNFIEQYRTERERQQKLAEEEEIRRLRKELVPKAQPMPYFNRPFIPRRSEKHPTIPKEPHFHLQQQKKLKSCMSWSEFSFRDQL